MSIPTSRCIALALSTFVLAAAPRALHAQACTGLPSLRGAAGPAGTVFGGASFVSGSQTFDAGVRLGAKSGLYGGAAVGLTRFDGLDGNTVTVAPELGVELAPSARSSFRLCPMVGANFGFGPHDDSYGTTLDMSSRTVGAGLGVGGVIPVGEAATTGRGLSLIPSASLSLQSSHATITIDGEDFSGSDSFGLLQLGVGFSFNQSVTILPVVALPIGVEGAEASLGLGVAYRFGARGK